MSMKNYTVEIQKVLELYMPRRKDKVPFLTEYFVALFAEFGKELLDEMAKNILSNLEHSLKMSDAELVAGALNKEWSLQRAKLEKMLGGEE